MKKLLIITSIAFALFSCSKDRLETDILNEGSEIVGFNKSVENVAYFSNVGAKPLDLPVVMQGLGDGMLPTSPITVSYEIDLTKSTAVLGTEFNFANTSGKVTIPAGGSFANIPLIVNTGSFNPTQKTELVLNLTSSTSGVIGEQYKSMKIVFVGCATALEGNYKYGTTNVVITKIAPNVYRSTYLPTFAAIYWFEFSDVCGLLTMTDWQFQGGNPMFKTGTTDMPTGSVISPSGNITFTNVNVTGVSWYVDRTFILTKI